jgi:hypothetical protein
MMEEIKLTIGICPDCKIEKPLGRLGLCVSCHLFKKKEERDKQGRDFYKNFDRDFDKVSLTEIALVFCVGLAAASLIVWALKL